LALPDNCGRMTSYSSLIGLGKSCRHSSSIGGFAEHQGSTKLTPRGLPIHATESERKTLEAGFKAMPQGFTRTLDQLADCLAKA